MVDFEAGSWPVWAHPWPSERDKRLFLERLLSIMCAHVRMRMYSVMSLADYRAMAGPANSAGRKALRKKRKIAAKIDYSLNSYGCILATYQWLKKRHITEDVLYVFEDGSEGAGYAKECYRQIESTGVARKFQIRDFVFGMKKQPALQAADIWAYEVRKHFLSTSVDHLRPSLKRLLRGIADGRGFVYDFPNLNGLTLELLTDGRKGGVDDQAFTVRRRPSL